MGSIGWPACIAATTLRWPGMIQKKTLALIAVATIAPTSRNAARPAKSWQANHDAKTMHSATATPTMRSPCSPCPSVRQMAS